jgi:hypothetical protein
VESEGVLRPMYTVLLSLSQLVQKHAEELRDFDNYQNVKMFNDSCPPYEHPKSTIVHHHEFLKSTLVLPNPRTTEMSFDLERASFR